MTGRAGAPAIEVAGLVKRYGERTVVDGVSLTVARGRARRPARTERRGQDDDRRDHRGLSVPRTRARSGSWARIRRRGGRALRARVGVMLQGGRLRHPGAARRDDRASTPDSTPTPRDPDELLELVGLRAVASTPYRRLSGGERQRLSLAVALVGRPEVLLLDEPTAGMDPEARAVTRELVAGLRAEGVAILLTSHDLVDVERLADRVDVLVAGRIVASGTVGEVVGDGETLEDAYLRLVRGRS